MSGSSSFSWIVDGEKVEIIFSFCRNGQWIDDENEYYYLHHFYSDIEFNHLDYKLIVTANEINEYWDVDDAAMLIKSLNLPDSVYVPYLLTNRTIEEFENSSKNIYWTVDGEEQQINIIFSQSRNAQWLNLDASPKFEFIKTYHSGKDEPEPPFEFCKRQIKNNEEEEDEDGYYYLFNSGIEFTYLNHNIVMTSDDLEDLYIDTASMLLQVLNLDAS
jgi:hypothetical protein